MIELPKYRATFEHEYFDWVLWEVTFVNFHGNQVGLRSLDNNVEIVVKLGSVKLHQFTGLLDKGGIEIYEAAIVVYDKHYVGDNVLKGGYGIVKYGNGSYYIDNEFAPKLDEEDIDNCGITVIG